ncbi:addiction module antidote protein [uncultured Methylobacterium sp.]|uniref:addiction module antidote protein n=1 Tax=uncultured Methylobacterium sp. TaxID=157278 RepID=UPI0035C9911D
MTETKPYDSADYLQTHEALAEYLTAVFEEQDGALLRHALGVAARARGMTRVARASGLSRESLYKALSEEGNPSLDTTVRVLRALGLRLTATVVPGAAEAGPP